MTEIMVTALYTYPIKSCGGLPHAEMALDARGFLHDRQWMIVSDADKDRGHFLTQREYPRMALIHPCVEADQLTLRAPGMPEIAVPLAQDHPADMTVVVWKDTLQAVDEGDAIAQWFSAYLGAAVRLVRFADEIVRAVSMKHTDQPSQTGFSDGYPLLLANESSLADLNDRLAARGKPAVPMTRFRPNIVIQGVDAWAEDTWKWVEIGGVRCEVAKPCARCAITTVDPLSGEATIKGEPLATLETFRRGTGSVSGVLFGQNVIHRALGTLRVGDRVELQA
ncbi:MAG: MOSC N-terminal beta barrel domain-containing protein [Anaerolineae bacterium]